MKIVIWLHVELHAGSETPAAMEARRDPAGAAEEAYRHRRGKRTDGVKRSFCLIIFKAALQNNITGREQDEACSPAGREDDPPQRS
ncbi:hypothetical protein CR205_04825 [Alteribacter lacisalsi]|uniref:Uncharacterized protein n=1 Tax=Alteribacter lacisalsi TaxID=2045244 RepID=A0A2W0HLF0_9BACI|nr:hypothetical protein CR205_04825 [Alteribacter lacisalsi]